MEELINKEYEEIKRKAVESFNKEMISKGICLRYVEDNIESIDGQHYKLRVSDLFLRKDTPFSLNEEGKKFIRDYFESKGVKFMFTNTVNNI